jgi:hypothetical protein
MINFPRGVTARFAVTPHEKLWVSLKYYQDLAATPPQKVIVEIAAESIILAVIN